jgi:acetoin utilization deacetylase AcuC-like enzyme
MSLILISSERFARHEPPPGHPESFKRADVMLQAASRWRDRDGLVGVPRAATRDELARVHTVDYINHIAETAGQSVALDPDTYTSPESYEVALLAAGAGVDAVERVMGGTATSAFALIRPPGHHAERDRAMGFCLFNNIAVAAAHARTLAAARVAIVDFDVHHGNGTQHTFESDPNVLYVSTHQFPYYPGTGAAHEIGLGKGKGSTVNLPLEVGAVDEDYRIVFAEVVVPVLAQFRPDVILVSAGFDAHERDPLAGMRLTTDAFAAMTLELRRVADECCKGRIVLVTEGGYDLQALSASLDAVVHALSASSNEPRWPVSTIKSARGRASADATKRALASFWKL